MNKLFKSLLVSTFLFGCAAMANTELVAMKSVPTMPQTNQPVTLFFQNRSELSNLEYVLQAQLNNSSSIVLTQTSETFWVGTLPPFTIAGQQSVSVNIYVQDKKTAERLREAQSQLLNRIAEINTVLLTETHPQKIAKLQSEKTEKENFYNQLVTDYSNLKKLYGSKNFIFSVTQP